jgi:hypothetical protein
VIWQEGAGDSNAHFLVTSGLVICSDIVSRVVRPRSFKLYLFLGIPLAIVTKRLAIQCAPESVYRLGGSVRQSCAEGLFRIGSLKEERNTQCLISELFESYSELLMFRSS